MNTTIATSKVSVVRGAVDAATAARWLAAIDAHSAWREREGDGFVASASSLRIGAVASLDAQAIGGELLRGDVGTLVRDSLGVPALLADQCWIRRQYAPHRAPPGHAPHAWHQDGALGHDFLDRDARRELRPMMTCWIALTGCGDLAPGLELAPSRGGAGLLGLDELAALASHDDEPTLRPVLGAGDAVVFPGDVPHRTHVSPAMRNDRTSLEIRFVPGTKP